MSITKFAERLLRLHVDRRGEVFYGTEVLPSVYREGDLRRLDAGYAELVSNGLLRDSGEEISFFGDWKRLYVPTTSGEQLATAEAHS